MVIQSDGKGCVRGDFNPRIITPEETPLSLMLEGQKFLWGMALETPIHIPLESDIAKAYPQLSEGRTIKSQEREHPVFPGFTIYALQSSDGFTLPRDIAYRCGYERIVFAGRPIIQESPQMPGFIEFICGACNRTMYSEEVEPNKCKGF